MVFVRGESSQTLDQFVARTNVPSVRGPVKPEDLAEAVRTVRSAPRPRALV
jgi:hypothetical protein